jgi:hypothetical protein
MPTIVALTNGSPHSWIIIHAVVDRFGPITILTEERESRAKLIHRRMKRQGLVAVLGQVGFLLLQRLLARRDRTRLAEIVASLDLHPALDGRCEILPVGSVNSLACREALARLEPDVVIVYGTAVLRKETLQAIKAPLLNLHSGITPAYRGQAGGYWAMAQSDPGRAGVTVHLVDAGVDTGGVIRQAPFTPTERDTFATYPYLQASVFRLLAVQAIEEALAGALKPFHPEGPSRQFYLPTLWGYLWTGLSKRVW